MHLVEPTNGSESEVGRTTFADSDICIASGESRDIVFSIERGAVTPTTVSAKAFTMELGCEFQ